MAQRAECVMLNQGPFILAGHQSLEGHRGPFKGLLARNVRVAFPTCDFCGLEVRLAVVAWMPLTVEDRLGP
jgi:hypothetical protein